VAALPPRPNFLIVGMRHCATRWLRFNLDRHPEICAPPVTPEFFTERERMSRQGLRWYRELFADWDGERFLGEASPSYADWNNNPREIALRIRRQLPDVRLIAVIGHPVTASRTSRRPGCAPSRRASSRRACTPTATTSRTSSRSWCSRTSGPTPPRCTPRSWPTSAPTRATCPRTWPAPRFAGDELVLDVPPPTEATRQQLYEWYRPDVRRLESMLERDFSHWDPGSNLVTYSPEDLFRYVFGDPDADNVTSN
jgi:hypothetical protein